MRKLVRRISCLILLVILCLPILGGYLWLRSGIAPMPSAPGFYVRFEKGQTLGGALGALQERKVIRNPTAFRLYLRLMRKDIEVRHATYAFKPGMTADQIIESFGKPISQMVRIPETNFAKRTANLLESKYDVLSAADYLDLIAKPSEFRDEVNFPLPKSGTLEGYLYPDTYDLPPLIGAREVIVRQLHAFERKAWPLIKDAKDPHRILVIASLIELEVANDAERPVVAGVIENRLKAGMSLGIDAAVNYAIGEWRPLTKQDLQIDSPYNLRRVKGLPPGPICSPSIKSIEAALHPAKHNYLYYAWNGPGTTTHTFAATYEEHLKNVARMRKRIAAAEAGSQ